MTTSISNKAFEKNRKSKKKEIYSKQKIISRQIEIMSH